MPGPRSTRSVPPTVSQAAALWPRYAAGESLAALAREFGCWRHDMRRRLALFGELRPEDRLPRPCRVCGASVRSSSPRNLCAAHVRRFCSRCEAPLPEGRVNRWCTRCEQARKPAHYLAQRASMLGQPRCCKTCSAPMPPGRLQTLCTDCYRIHRRAVIAQRIKEGRHRCADCGVRMSARQQQYCPDCQNARARLRRQPAPEPYTGLRLARPKRSWQQPESRGG